MAADLFAHESPAVLPPDGEKGQVERGAFYTPDALALAICRTLDAEDIRPQSIFEPGCGGGAFLRAAHAIWPEAQLLGVDLVPACTGPGIVRTQDLFDPEIPTAAFDLVLGNPDFSIAERVVRRGLELVKFGGYVALLLLASFEESAGRVPLFEKHPLFRRQILAQRASFTNDGQVDQRPYALFVWQRGYRGAYYQGLRPLVWR